jgi:hypothetical protein
MRRKFYFEEGEKGFVRLHLAFPKVFHQRQNIALHHAPLPLSLFP